MYETTYGEKYEATKKLTSTEVVALIRADIKAAVKAGELPPAKYSVRKDSYSGGWSVRIRVSDLPFLEHDTDHIAAVAENRSHAHLSAGGNRQNVGVLAVEQRLERIAADYNYDGSDIQTDYFNVRFYCSVSFDSDGEYGRLITLYKAAKAMKSIAADFEFTDEHLGTAALLLERARCAKTDDEKANATMTLFAADAEVQVAADWLLDTLPPHAVEIAWSLVPVFGNFAGKKWLNW